MAAITKQGLQIAMARMAHHLPSLRAAADHGRPLSLAPRGTPLSHRRGLCLHGPESQRLPIAVGAAADRNLHIFAQVQRDETLGWSMMGKISYLDLFDVPVKPANHDRPVLPGDLVTTGSCDWPRYTVIAVWKTRAWVRDVLTGEDAVVDAQRCRWRA